LLFHLRIPPPQFRYRERKPPTEHYLWKTKARNACLNIPQKEALFSVCCRWFMEYFLSFREFSEYITPLLWNDPVNLHKMGIRFF